MKLKKGFGIIEVIVAMSIFMIIAVTGVTTTTGSFSTNRLGDEETSATVFAQEGIEAARSIRNQGWTTPFLATNCSSGCGVAISVGVWAWSGSNNTSGKFTRAITVLDVQRNGGGDIVDSGGTNDPNIKKVTSTVTWNFSSGRSNSAIVTTYLSNWKITIAPTATPTSTPTPTPIANCNGYAISQGYVSGTCRQNTTQCTNNGEVHLIAGDAVCSAAPPADTCCALPSGSGTPTPTPTISLSPTPTPSYTPTPTSTPTLTPTPTVSSTCSPYCINNGFSGGTCRQNSVQCGHNGETYQPGGDVFCTGGSQVDTCCCL